MSSKIIVTDNCKQYIFRKTYDYRSKRLSVAAVLEIYRVQLGECRNLQRIDHPFIVSYLGYEEFIEDISGVRTFRQTVLYLEFCGGGDLGILHVTPKSPMPNPPRSHDGFAVGLPEATPLNEGAVWTLVYQLFLALAYLHYGVRVSRHGACQCEPHWTPLMHRDIRPNNGQLPLDAQDMVNAQNSRLFIRQGWISGRQTV